MTKAPRLFTIGAFGFTESAFFDTLSRAKVDLFCDIRRRRGVRGAEYSFVNSSRLQNRLKELGIRYIHALELAPPIAVRELQWEADEEAHIPKRKRTELSPSFVKAYTEACLTAFDSRKFLESISAEAASLALFCAEREPAACHRSLVAARISRDLGIPVHHLVP